MFADAPNPVAAVAPNPPPVVLVPKPVFAVLPPNPVLLVVAPPKRLLPPVLAVAPNPVEVLFGAVDPKPPPKPPDVVCVLVLLPPNKLFVVDRPVEGAPNAGLAAPKPVLAVFVPNPFAEVVSNSIWKIENELLCLIGSEMQFSGLYSLL